VTAFSVTGDGASKTVRASSGHRVNFDATVAVLAQTA